VIRDDEGDAITAGAGALKHICDTFIAEVHGSN
jgi:hypothetical protein